MVPTVAFVSNDPARNPRSFLFADPVDEIVVHTPSEVLPALKRIEREVAAGLHAAGFLGYEAASGLDPAMRVKAESSVPLVWFGLFRRRIQIAPDSFGSDDPFSLSDWTFSIDRRAYAAAIERIRDYIAAGDTYQVNFTFRRYATFRGSPIGFFRVLCRSQRAGYSAYVDLGRYKVVSVSPELFFRLEDRELMVRPMKGTMRRGRWKEEDEALARSLELCPKNRAENLMIVDLMRSDLGRVAEVGTVRVPRLFEVEHYDTVLQMTSTVRCRLRPDVHIPELFAAVFPSGSVTGAPKIRTMGIIDELEDTPRHVYTGSIGFVSPGHEAVFSVAIRTVLLDCHSNRAEFGVGGGITYDSVADAEHEECKLKARFLTTPRPDFELLETFLYQGRRGYFLLDCHLQRMETSAHYFGFCFDRARVVAALHEEASMLGTDRFKVRLLLARNGKVNITHTALSLTERRDLPSVAIASDPVDSRDPFLYHKTTRREVYESRAKTRPDRADVILMNERGEITESTIANVVVRIDGQLYTPPVSCGLLPGTFRADLLARGCIAEHVLHREDLERTEALYLVNSVNRWTQVKLEP